MYQNMIKLVRTKPESQRKTYWAGELLADPVEDWGKYFDILRVRRVEDISHGEMGGVDRRQQSYVRLCRLCGVSEAEGVTG